MASLTVRNKLDQQIESDKRVGVDVVPYTIAPLATFAIGDNEVGPSMYQQISNGILQIVSTVPSADAGSGTIAALNLAAIGSRKLLDIDTGEYFTPDNLFFRIITASGVTGAAEISIGTNAPNYDNLMASKVLSALAAVDDTWNEAIEGKGLTVNGPAEIWIRVKAAAPAVALEADVYVTGKGNLT